MNVEITNEVISDFLEGSDPQKYIVSIEVGYGKAEADLIINDPTQGKYIQKHKFKPFLWMKEGVVDILFDGDKRKIKEKAKKYGISFKTLTTSNSEGHTPDRLVDSYKYMAITREPYGKLINFFREGGMNIYSEEHRHMFMAVAPVEQFMIQTGKRMFKGFDEYDELHRFQFDIETTGLTPEKDTIFQIGMRDNRGFEEIIEVVGLGDEHSKSEGKSIENFFKVIDYLKPDVITGYNSENFDWNFFDVRCQKLDISFTGLSRTLNPNIPLKRKESRIKLGGKTENYLQTQMWGYNILDTYHGVRKAQAINSDIKKASLKYITKFSKINKENRVYVPGDMLNKIWADKENDYYFNDTNGDWFVYKDEKDPKNEGVIQGIFDKQLEKIQSGNYEKVDGAYIIRRYLLDDLWETEKVDGIFNQATFLIAKILPTSFMRSATMGTASTWKLIMMSWSYENKLALPSLEPKRDFVGGLSRLLEVGYAERVAKLDYAALYPNIELTHDIFPSLDITGVMKGLLYYIVNQRDVYKFKKNHHNKEVHRISDLLKTDPNNETLIKELSEHEYLKSKYDKKQLPLKILANSFFGSFGASYLFNWGDVDCAEETTCRGRQYLRLMVKHFYEKYGFRPLVGDSVTHDTPIYIKWKDSNKLDILPISDIFNEDSEVLDEESLRDLEIKPYEVLTVNGWKEINYVYRHETNKKIHRISTKDKLVCVTEDHSLFQNGKQIKPKNLKRGDALDVRELPTFELDDDDNLNEDLFYLYGYFLGNGSATYGNRKEYYKSKKTGKTNINKGKRSVFKISSSNYDKLIRLQKIIKDNFDVNCKIKDHRESSNVYNLICYVKKMSVKFSEDFYTSYKEKKIPNYVLNTNKKNKLAFLEGVFSSDGYGDTLEEVSDIGMKSQVAMSGISYIMETLSIDREIKVIKDKENFISLKLKNRGNSKFTNKTKMKSDEVWLNEVITNKCEKNYVYDISTEDGTFIGGIGGVDLKNTDGFNFAIPKTVDEIKYFVKGSHRLTKSNEGETLSGLDAVVADFNEEYMIGRMGLDVDDVADATINFSRKNYANKIDGKTKLVGNTIKSSTLPGYIEDFINTGMTLLLDNEGKKFIDLYYSLVDDIYNYRIPILKMASKSKVNSTMDEYDEYCKKRNKAGNLNSRKAYMEIIKKYELDPDLGDTIYYVNTGTAKSHGDMKTTKDKDGNVTVELRCKLIPTEQMEKNPEITTDEYNVPKYLGALNKRLEPLLVCFDNEVRDNLIINIKKNRKTKEYELTPRQSFTNKQCQLTSGNAYEASDQDTYEELMTLDDREIKFWIDFNEVPNNMTEEEWVSIKEDYVVRMERLRLELIDQEIEDVYYIFQNKLDLVDFSNIKEHSILPNTINKYCDLVGIEEEGKLISIGLKSRKHGNVICTLNDMLKYYGMAKVREEFYKTVDKTIEDTEELIKLWIEYKNDIEFKKGSDYLLSDDKDVEGLIEPVNIDGVSYDEDDEWNF